MNRHWPPPFPRQRTSAILAPMSRTRIAVLALGALLALPGAATAEMQCEGRLIGNGATMDEVLRYCGEPQQRARGDRVVGYGLWDDPGDVQRIPIEVWTYQPPGEFTRKLIFEAGRLEQIQTGGYAGF